MRIHLVRVCIRLLPNIPDLNRDPAFQRIIPTFKFIVPITLVSLHLVVSRLPLTSPPNFLSCDKRHSDATSSVFSLPYDYSIRQLNRWITIKLDDEPVFAAGIVLPADMVP
jgi:hypothetical protein